MSDLLYHFNTGKLIMELHCVRIREDNIPLRS